MVFFYKFFNKFIPQINLIKENLEDLLFFSDNEIEFKETTLDNLLNDQSLMLLLKVHVTADIEDIDDVLLRLVYGDSKKRPGTQECVYALLLDSIEDELTTEIKDLEGSTI